MSMLIGAQHWWQDCGEIARLLRWLDKHDEHGPLEVIHCIDIVQKPHHWDAEYQEMCREQGTDSREDPACGEELIR